MTLFERPCFGMTHSIYRDRGHPYIADLIARIRAKWTMNKTDGRHA